MRYSKHPVTVVLLFLGIPVGIALSMAAGFWLDAHRSLGSGGVIEFLVASAAILLYVEAVAVAAGEWIEGQLTTARLATPVAAGARRLHAHT